MELPRKLLVPALGGGREEFEEAEEGRRCGVVVVDLDEFFLAARSLAKTGRGKNEGEEEGEDEDEGEEEPKSRWELMVPIHPQGRMVERGRRSDSPRKGERKDKERRKRRSCSLVGVVRGEGDRKGQ